MFPLWALRLLPYGIAVLALIGAVIWIDHAGYQRAENNHKLEMAQADQRAMDLAVTIGDALGKQAVIIDQRLGNRIDAIDTAERTIIRPTLEREIIRESRLSDPAAGITDGVRGAINAARAQTACNTAPDGSATCALPAARPADR